MSKLRDFHSSTIPIWLKDTIFPHLKILYIIQIWLQMNFSTIQNTIIPNDKITSFLWPLLVLYRKGESKGDVHVLPQILRSLKSEAVNWAILCTIIRSPLYSKMHQRGRPFHNSLVDQDLLTGAAIIVPFPLPNPPHQTNLNNALCPSHNVAFSGILIKLSWQVHICSVLKISAIQFNRK